PDAAPLLAFFAQTGAKKECSLYIGDGTHDLACAQNAGVAFANAAWGSAPLPGAAHVLHSPSELISLL
ncbi:MAG: HAD family hydrolase, partial [Christensenellaceae bacterium]